MNNYDLYVRLKDIVSQSQTPQRVYATAPTPEESESTELRLIALRVKALIETIEHNAMQIAVKAMFDREAA